MLATVETTDLTVQILRDIRDDVRGLREEQRATRDELRSFQQSTNARFEAIETALRDMAEQLVMLARGIKTALEVWGDADRRFDEVDRRLKALEADRSH
jgi:predicted nuclease with TOPRIM domain